MDDLQVADLCPVTCFALTSLEPPRARVSTPLNALPEVLCGRYRLEGLLGAGGMGAVYRARDLLHEQMGDPKPYVAVKLLSEAISPSPDASALLYNEFALTRHLHHPNVLRLHTFDVDTEHQRAFIVMELLRGPTLDRLLCEWPFGFRWQQLCDIALPLLDALAHAHEQGVLHGDIKPGNVLLSDDGVRLFDFGLGQAETDTLHGLARLNRSCFNAWTPSYAAPELLDGAPLTRAADVFALGCLLYELASGKHPFNRRLSTHVRDQQPRPTLKRPKHLARKAWPTLRTALAFDPAQRTVSVKQLRDAIVLKPGFWG